MYTVQISRCGWCSPKFKQTVAWWAFLHWHRLTRVSSWCTATMISLELWRARIGTFNNKRTCSGCSLSSLSSSSLAPSTHCRRHRGSADVSQEEPSKALTSSSSCSSLAIKEQSQEFSSTDHHSVLTTSSTQPTLSCSSQSCGSSSFTASSSLQSSSSFFPTSGTCSLHRSLLRDAVITLLIAIISQLLMIAGDIETNPGPKHGGEVTEVYDVVEAHNYVMKRQKRLFKRLLHIFLKQFLIARMFFGQGPRIRNILRNLFKKIT